MSQTFSYPVQNVYIQTDDLNSSTTTGLMTIDRVQSCNVSISFPYTQEFGWDGGGDQTMVTRPRVQTDISYYPTYGENEVLFGFHTGTNTPALIGLTTEKNLYFLSNKDRWDNIGHSGENVQIFGLGNSLVTSYSVNASVGQPIQASIGLESLNLLVQEGSRTQNLPSIDKRTAESISGSYHAVAASTLTPYQTGQVTAINSEDIAISFYDSTTESDPSWISVLQPGDVVLSFSPNSAIGQLMSGENACLLESFSFNVGIEREDVQELGWAYPESRPTKWPISVSINADAYLTDLQSDAINKVGIESGYSMSLIAAKHGRDVIPMRWDFTNAKLQSQNVTAQIGQFNRVTFNWSAVIYDVMRTGESSANFYVKPGDRTSEFIDEDSIIALAKLNAEDARIIWGSNYYPSGIETPYPALEVTVPTP